MTICRLQIYFPKDPPHPLLHAIIWYAGHLTPRLIHAFFSCAFGAISHWYFHENVMWKSKPTTFLKHLMYSQNNSFERNIFSSFLLAWSHSQHQLWVCVNPSTKQKILSSIGLDVACCAKGRNICGMETQWNRSVEPATSENPTNPAKRRYFFFLRCSLAMAEGIWDI